MTTILQGIGWFLLKVYEFFTAAHIPCAYALSLVVLTVLIKLILFPLNYKAKQSMMKTTLLQDQMKKLEAQYANNRAKYQEELQKLYQKEGVNPMGGCLWSLLPLPILMGIYYIVRRPMLYMMRIPADSITAALEAVNEKFPNLITGNSAYQEVKLAAQIAKNSDVLATVQNAVGEYASRLCSINFNFFGIDLSETPKVMFWKTFDTLGVWPSIGLFLIPLAVTALNFWYTQYSTKTNAALTDPEAAAKKKKKKNDEPQKMNATERQSRTMMYMMPLMYLWFGFIMPAGMCVYMAVNALLTVPQDAISVRMMKKSFAKMREERRVREEKEKEEEKARKAAIAEQRRINEEAQKTKKSSKASKKAAAKAEQKKNTRGRIGIRTYALGRDYDPDRYGGVTTYRDPQEIIDEQAIEEALKSKRKRKADAVEKALTQAEESGDLEAVQKLQKQQAVLAEAEEAAEIAEEIAAEESGAALPESTEASAELPEAAEASAELPEAEAVSDAAEAEGSNADEA